MSEEEITGANNPAAGDEDKQEQTVPVSVVQGLREELKELKETNAVYRAQLMAGQQPQAQEPAPKNPLDDIGDDDVLTGADLKRLVPSIVGPLSQQISQVSVQGSKPDFEKVITKHLPKVLEAKPHLGNMLKSIKDPGQRLLMAYEFGVTDPAYTAATVTAGFEEEAKKAEANASKPGSLGNVKGQGSKSPEMRYANMTDDEIEAKYQQVVYGSR